MKYIIMCGGEYDTWETPRQLTEFKGETLVARTIRLLKAEGVNDIAISATDERFSQFGLPVLRHNNNYRASSEKPRGCWVEAFYPTDEPACYLFGDVFFSPAAINTIVNTEVASVMYFASAPPFCRQHCKPHAEPFAFKVVDQKRFRAAISFVIENENSGIFARRPIAWELWQVLNNENVRDINFKNYVAINDYTCDIDKAEDIAKIARLF